MTLAILHFHRLYPSCRALCFVHICLIFVGSVALNARPMLADFVLSLSSDLTGDSFEFVEGSTIDIPIYYCGSMAVGFVGGTLKTITEVPELSSVVLLTAVGCPLADYRRRERQSLSRLNRL